MIHGGPSPVRSGRQPPLRGPLFVCLGLGALALVVGADAATAADPDSMRAAWHYRRDLRPAAGSATGAANLAAVPLPPDLLARCQPGARDLRLVTADGTELPYLISRKGEEATVLRYSGALSDARREPWQRSVWEVDLGQDRVFDTIELDIPEENFAKRALLELAGADRRFHPLLDDAGVFDQRWSRWHVHHTTYDLDAPAQARYLRITLSDRTTRPVTLRGVEVRRLTTRSGQRWRREVPLTAVPGARGVSRYQLTLPAGLPLDAVELAAAERIFVRRVRLVEQPATAVPEAAPPSPIMLGEGEVYRVQVSPAAPAHPGVAAEVVAGEDLRFAARAPGAGTVFLEITDADSPPLSGVAVAVSGVADQLIFPLPGPSGALPQGLRLYYGNATTRAPSYDVELLRGFLDRYHGDLVLGETGPEIANPRYRPAPPLAAVQGSGAAVDLNRWRLVASLPVPDHEDLYAVTLPPEAVAALRPDLGDLRVVDGAARQVPYVLEPDAVEKAVPWQITPAPDGATGAHRYFVQPTHIAAATTAEEVPLVALELDFAEGFFARAARILTPPPPESWGPRRGVETRWSGALERRGESGGEGKGEGAAAGQIRIDLGGRRSALLILEIDDGDNARLTPRGVAAVLRLPRIACKLRADPGGYRVLLGNQEAAPPRYDIETLRQQVLDYTALPLMLASPTRNPAFRPRAGDYLRNAPPTLVLWGALGLAVFGLLFLTVRLLRRVE